MNSYPVFTVRAHNAAQPHRTPHLLLNFNLNTFHFGAKTKKIIYYVYNSIQYPLQILMKKGRIKIYC